MAGRGGQVASAAQATQSYTQRVQASGQKWQQNVQGCQINPMERAADNAQKAISAYTAKLSDAGPSGWVARLRATPVGMWKAGADAQAVQRYQMAKGAQKWNRWYTDQGMAMATHMRDQAQQDRGNNVPYMQRIATALDIAKNEGKKGM